MSHGRVHERIDLALRHTRLVHGCGDLAENAERVRIFADQFDGDLWIPEPCQLPSGSGSSLPHPLV
jgi:hypothetical protein